MKKYCLLFSLIAGVLVGCAGSLTRPSESFDSVSGGNADSLSLAISSVEVPSFDSSHLPEDQTFSIVASGGGSYEYIEEENTFVLTSAGEYDCYGDLSDGQIRVSAGDEDEVVLNLNGCSLSCSFDSPIYIESADQVDLSSKKDTENYIYDLRGADFDDDASGSGAIFADSDLKLKGNGSLEIQTAYNNGVHTKKDLEIKNVELSVKAYNNAIKGNDSVAIESGRIVAISTGGDAVKTTSTDFNKKNEQRGSVRISGGEVTLYAMCDGIDASSDVVISSEAVVRIFTDSYSEYSEEVKESSSSTMYLRLSSSVYRSSYAYCAYFYNTDGTYCWKEASYYGAYSAFEDNPAGRDSGSAAETPRTITIRFPDRRGIPTSVFTRIMPLRLPDKARIIRPSANPIRRFLRTKTPTSCLPCRTERSSLRGGLLSILPQATVVWLIPAKGSRPATKSPFRAGTSRFIPATTECMRISTK